MESIKEVEQSTSRPSSFCIILLTVSYSVYQTTNLYFFEIMCRKDLSVPLKYFVKKRLCQQVILRYFEVFSAKLIAY